MAITAVILLSKFHCAIAVLATIAVVAVVDIVGVVADVVVVIIIAVVAVRGFVTIPAIEAVRILLSKFYQADFIVRWPS